MVPKNYKPEDHPLIEYWQNVCRHTMKHKSVIDSMIKLEKYWLSQFEKSEIILALKNYDYILGFPPETFYAQYRHSFTSFFRKGARKDPPFFWFLEENEPKKRVKNNSVSINQNQPSEEVVL